MYDSLCAVAGPEADLSVFEGHDLHVIPAASTLTFEHTYTVGASGEGACAAGDMTKAGVFLL